MSGFSSGESPNSNAMAPGTFSHKRFRPVGRRSTSATSAARRSSKTGSVLRSNRDWEGSGLTFSVAQRGKEILVSAHLKAFPGTFS
jgi:hypothetical protein